MNAVVTNPLNPLRQLGEQGQSVWLDYIRESLMSSGALDRLIDEDGLRGLTSNPSIFAKAIAGSGDYQDALETLRDRQDLSASALFEQLAIADIRRAADHFAPTYRATRKRDGYVSLEVSPAFAHDTAGTITEARRLWHEVNRANLMIKVPATREGLVAIETLLAEAINVNVTLLFSVDVYAQAAEAYLRALETRARAGAHLAGVASVASFFVSRIDTAVDQRISERLENLPGGTPPQELASLQGKAAIANARIAYRRYREIYCARRWQHLARAGAQTQRLLWASTSTKNPTYRDIRYVEELVGRDTVNTMPPATLEAFRDHGTVRPSLTEALDESEGIIATLARYGIDLETVSEELLNAGVASFASAYQQLLQTISRVRSEQPRQCRLARLSLPQALQQASDEIIDDFDSGDKLHRLWARDATLWTGADENRWLDWLGVAHTQLDHLGDLKRLTHLAEGRYFQHAVVLGMGGSSLTPELFARSFGVRPNHPELLVLDSTDPDQIQALEAQLDLSRTAFIAASKSGTTLETNLLLDYFLARVSEQVGKHRAAEHFGVITDPGSPLEARALQQGFRKIFHGVPGIGGRYSALSSFGIVPAAVAGIGVKRILRAAETMAEACAACVPARDNPGLQLGAVLGAAQRLGRDKITLLCSAPLAAFGAWLEQLLAESTGKQGKALIPVDGEQLGAPQDYREDRLFLYLRLASQPDPRQEQGIERLRAAGQPVVQIDIDDVHQLGGELFRCELATAIAASVMHINPFDQPDVESSKAVARDLSAAYERSGRLPPRESLLQHGTLSFFAADDYAAGLPQRGYAPTAVSLIEAHLDQLRPGDYFALLAYVNERDDELGSALQRLRHTVRDRYRVATCFGYGPRYLHSTGQAHKGGPDTGVFLLITRDSNQVLAIPGHRAGFATVEAAQAQGDFKVLAERGRRMLRVHLGGDALTDLLELQNMVDAAAGNHTGVDGMAGTA
jgi:transaldolase/glucose-6-phosphate isomerase